MLQSFRGGRGTMVYCCRVGGSQGRAGSARRGCLYGAVQGISLHNVIHNVPVQSILCLQFTSQTVMIVDGSVALHIHIRLLNEY